MAPVTPLTHLDDFSRIDAVPVMLDVICRTTGLGFAAIARVTEGKWIALAVRDKAGFGVTAGTELPVDSTLCKDLRQPGEIIVIDQVSADARYADHPVPKQFGFQSYIAVPIMLGGGRFGTLCALDRAPAEIDTPQARDMFALFARLTAFYLEQGQQVSVLESQVASRTEALHAERHSLRALAGELQRIREDERQSLAREVHDELGQSLAFLRIELANVRSALRRGGPGSIEQSLSTLDLMDANLDSVIRGIQRIVSQLRPVVLDLLGFAAAANWLVSEFSRHTRIRASFHDFYSQPLPDGVPIVLYRVLQEALTNVSRHAHANSVTATLQGDGSNIVLRIADDGRGIAGSSITEAAGFGLRGMTERLRAVGGELRIESDSRGGVRVIATVPAAVTAQH